MWKDIEGYEGLYQVSKFGEIMSFYFGETILTPILNNNYLSICLCKNKIKKIFRIHRLVAIAFIPNLKNKKTVNHKNGIKIDNWTGNLEWATHNEQMIHSVNNKLNPRGEKVGTHKLTKEQILEIRKKYKWYECTQIMLAKEYNVSRQTIYQILSRRRWNDI